MSKTKKQKELLSDEILQFIKNFSDKIRHPRAECKEAAIALGILLAQKGVYTKLVKGIVEVPDNSTPKRPKETSTWRQPFLINHWWLVYQDMIIDPTKHQFNPAPSEYIDQDKWLDGCSFDSIAGYLDSHK